MSKRKNYFHAVTQITVGLMLCFWLSACENNDELKQGEQLVVANCKVCHAQGINGAPIIGNKKMWGKRISKGREALVTNAVNGVGLMPAKGGNTELTEAQIDLAVGYFLSQLSDK